MRRVLCLLAAVTVLVTGAAAPALAAGPAVRPKDDTFYRYTGSTPLAQIAPGTVLASRDVTLAASTNGLPIPATQLLYRTVDEQKQPAVTVTTVAVPPAAAAKPSIVAYLSFYDSLSDKCDPSFTLTGGDPGAANGQLTGVEQALVAQYYAAGWIVTVPDFEGTALHWTAGHEAGWSTLDAVRATESFLKLDKQTPVGLSGYSGGSIAGDWAAELQPAYAPEVNLVGAALGGLPVHFGHNLTYIEGSNVWSGIIPAVLVALSRAYDIDLPKYASAKGLELAAKVQDQCIGDFSGTTPGLTSDQLLKPEYRPLLKQPEFAAVINRLIMGTEPGAPTIPLLMQVGNDPNNSDGGPNDKAQGDDIMITGDVEALAREYCDQGVPVQFNVLSNLSHENAALAFEPQATQFLAARFAGAPFADNCAMVGKGNDLSPLPVGGASPAPSPGSGGSGGSGGSAGGTPGASPSGSASGTSGAGTSGGASGGGGTSAAGTGGQVVDPALAQSGSAVASGSGLPRTGLAASTAVAGLVLLVAAGYARRRRVC